MLMRAPEIVQDRRERVLELTRSGHTERAIAELLGLNVKTVANDRAALRRIPRGDPSWTPLPARCTPRAYGSTGALVCGRHGCTWGTCIEAAPDDRALYCPAGCGRPVADCPAPGDWRCAEVGKALRGERTRWAGCLWCDDSKPLTDRPGRQKFCGEACRIKFGRRHPGRSGREYERTCAGCGGVFTSGSSLAKWCSRACRRAV